MNTMRRLGNRLLSHPKLYKLQQVASGSRSQKRYLFKTYLSLSKGMKLLDVGCGPAPDRDLLGEIQWTGIDHEERYVNYVKKVMPMGDNIILGGVATLDQISEGEFDVVLLSGVLHHIDDLSATLLLQNCHRILKPGGMVTAIDPVRTDHSSWLEKLLIESDRGEYIRTFDQYQTLFPASFHKKESFIEEGLSWLPQATLVSRLQKG